QELDERRLAALGLPKQPEHRHRQFFTYFLQVLLNLRLAFGRGEQALELAEHAVQGLSSGTARRERDQVAPTRGDTITPRTHHIFPRCTNRADFPAPILRSGWP